MSRRLSAIDEDLVSEAARPKFAPFVRSLLRPLLDDIGFAGAAGDSDERRSLRAVLIGTLGTMDELRQHDILDRVEVGQQMVELIDEA